MPGELLHPEYFKAPFDMGIGRSLERQLATGPDTPPENPAQGRYAPPELTVLIQSINDQPGEIGALLDDVEQAALAYGQTRVKKLIVATGPIWRGTRERARYQQAEVITTDIAPDLRSRLIRTGLEAAESDIVFTTVGHAQLTNRRILATAAHYAVRPDFGGAFGLPLRGRHATLPEWAGARALGLDVRFSRGPKQISPKVGAVGGIGLMGADCSVLRHSVVKELGGFDESFGFGGADGNFGHLALEAGLTVTRDPRLSVHHTDGLGARESLRLVRAWSQMGENRPFIYEDWVWHHHLGL
ncbi:MAG TPA: hypothetical protein VF733_04115 [Candidatus Saccharimonadales bacterium]